jgi:hypothetical protein
MHPLNDLLAVRSPCAGHCLPRGSHLDGLAGVRPFPFLSAKVQKRNFSLKEAKNLSGLKHNLDDFV